MQAPLRQSTIKDYLFCPHMFQLRHLLKVPAEYRNAAAVNGTIVHRLLEALHSDWDLDTASEYDQLLEKEEFTSVEATVPIQWKDRDKQVAAYRRDAVDMLANYRDKDYNRNAKILLSEVTFLVRIGDHYYRGTIDQLRENPDGSLELVDFKTSQATPSPLFLATDYQFSLYAWALEQGWFLTDGKSLRFGKRPDYCTLYHLRHHIPYRRNCDGGKAGEERGNPRYTTTRTDEQFRQMLGDLHSIAEAIRRQLFPRNPNQWTCSMCKYRTHCQSTTVEPDKQQLEQIKSKLLLTE
jgi:CRISPR/Cas system-associated exonuclease Cas4 (RecB family)